MIPPLLFKPIYHEKVWGGRALEKLGKTLPPNVSIGESWELADLPETIPHGRSIIENGPLAGMTLGDAIEWHERAIMGGARLTEDGGFPLLIKFLDARENLSVQVHPDTAYIKRHPEALLKSEAWIVLDAEPGAVIYKGVKPGVDRARFAEAVAQGTVPDVLNSVAVEPGECHYLPSGTLHALGGGIVVAEVQTPSDTTFRVYDWGREHGSSPRQMHIEQAMKCISFDPPPAASVDPHPLEVGGVRTERLVQTEHFAIERISMIDAERLEVVTSGMPEVWMVLSGGGVVDVPEGEGIGQGEVREVMLERGRTALMPAAMPDTKARLARGSSILRITLPSPIRGMIAR